MGRDEKAELRALCAWWLEIFGRMRFFPQFVNMAAGKHRGALLVSLPRKTAASVRLAVEADRDASRILTHLAFAELAGGDVDVLRELVAGCGDDAPALTKAIMEVRPAAREFVVVCNIFTDDRTTAAAVNWAVVREEA